MASDTKIRIIEAAEKLILENGFNGLGISEILKNVNIPKGSFYHYFSSKEDFGVEVLKHYVAGCKQHGIKLLLNPETASSDPTQRILDYVDSLIEQTLENDEKCPCLVVKVNNEVANTSDAMREVLAVGMNQCEYAFTQVLKEGIANGSIRSDLPVRLTATMINDLVNGALLRVETIRSVEPMREVRQFTAELLGKPED